jgi:hypothetical protein
MFVSVVDSQQQPLMPTTPARARRWVKSGKATPFWKGGVFCVRLNREPSARVRQPIAVGVDPGSKKEGYSVVSAAHTYLNIQADAPNTPGTQGAVSSTPRQSLAQEEEPATVHQSTVAVEITHSQVARLPLSSGRLCGRRYQGHYSRQATRRNRCAMG